MHRFLYPLLFLISVFILFSPIFFAGFAGDDIYQLVRQPFFHDGKNVPAVFGEVIAAPSGHSSLTGFFYRPLTYSVYTLVYSSFNGNPFPFHLLQLILYALAVYLVFLLFKQFFSKHISLFLALIFLIHPANNELASYIAALSDTLSLAFGTSALILIGRQKRQSFQVTITICLLLFLSLLSKETGAVFLFLASVYAAYKKQLRQLLIPMIATGVVYLLCRMNAASHVMFTYIPHPVVYNSLAEHIYLSVQIAFAFIREIIVPTRDAIKQHAFQLTLINTFQPAGLLLLSLGLYSIFFMWIKKHKKTYLHPFVFFSAWVVGGMVFFLQIIPLEVIFAERWLYITEIGILGMFGILVSTVRLPKTKWATAIYILFGILFFCFAAETIILNIMWLDWQQHFHNL